MNTRKPTDTLMVSDGVVSDGDQAAVEQGGYAAPILAPGKQGKQGETAGYDWMGPSLRRMYDDVLNEPVPESFMELLKQLHDRQDKR